MTRRLTRTFVSLALTGVAALASLNVGAVTIHVVLPSEDAHYVTVLESIRESLGARASVSVATDGGLPENADAIVTVGVAATRLVAESGDKRPSFAVMIPASSWRVIVANQSHLPRTAVFLDQPFLRQLALIEAVLPAARDVGVLLGPVSMAEDEAISAAANELGLRIHAARPATPEDIIPAASSVLRRSDALLAVPDPTVYNRSSVRGVLVTSFRMRRPLFGFSEAWVQAGAVAAVFSTPVQVGADLADMLHAWLDDPHSIPAPRSPVRFSIAVNRQVAFALGINAPTDEFLQRIVDGAGGRP